MPNWALVFCAGVFAATTYRLAKRQRRAEAVKRGNCPSCGYNLTANTSGVCPECGTPVSSKPGAVA